MSIKLLFAQNASSFGFYLGTGIGHSCGGYGFNTSLRIKHYFLYGNYGFIPSKKTKTIVVPESFNVGFGLNYLFNIRYSTWSPIVGLHLGWLNNYYNEKIGNNSYNPNLYGASLYGGYYYFDEFLNLNFGLHAYSKYSIYKINEHPFYDEGNSIHFSPQASIAISIDKTIKAISNASLKNKTKNNKLKQNYKGHSIAEKDSKKLSKRAQKKIYASTIESTCIKSKYSEINNLASRGICSNLFVYQVIFNNQVLFAYINLDSINIYPGCNQFFLENNRENIIVAIDDSSEITNDYCCKMANLYTNFIEDVSDSVYFGVKGKITIAALKLNLKENNNDIFQLTIKISELKCVRKINDTKEDIYFDELIIWDAKSVDSCK